MEDYKKALEKAKELHETSNPEIKLSLEKVFPELKESKNERIRKDLIRAFKSLNTLEVWNGINRKDILNWLESQTSPEWTEEDECTLKGILDDNKSMCMTYRNWLRSLKNKFKLCSD
jgi:hypothetical protein